MEKYIATVMAALEINEAAAKSVIAVFIEEGFTSIDEAIEWANDTLQAPAHIEREDIRFDKQEIFYSKEDEEQGSNGFHIVTFKKAS